MAFLPDMTEFSKHAILVVLQEMQAIGQALSRTYGQLCADCEPFVGWSEGMCEMSMKLREG